MAIEDNTKYGLTGAQIKDLAEKVKNAGGVKTLTTADYNYPVDSPNRVALWLLEPGIYTAAADNVSVYINTSSILPYGGAAIVGKHYMNGSTEEVAIFKYSGGNNASSNLYVTKTSSGTLLKNLRTISVNDIIDNLYSTNIDKALSANQGKVLKDELDKRIIFGGTSAPTTSTVGQVSSLYVCVINMTPKMYICTAVSGNTYTWTEFSAGPTPEPEIDPTDQAMVLPTNVPIEEGEADLTGTNASFDEDNTLNLGA